MIRLLTSGVITSSWHTSSEKCDAFVQSRGRDGLQSTLRDSYHKKQRSQLYKDLEALNHNGLLSMSRDVLCHNHTKYGYCSTVPLSLLDQHIDCADQPEVHPTKI